MTIIARTIGFEAEYECNVEPLIRRLHNDGLAADYRVHDYHCGCHTCSFDLGLQYRFRAQRDSSCAGEIITNIITLDELADTAEYLSVACYDVDAEPGLNAGLHVHVGVDSEDYEARLGTMLVFALYEQSLGYLAAGPFRALRGMNRTVTQGLNRAPYADQYGTRPWDEAEIHADIGLLATQTPRQRHEAWNQLWMNWERHANLAPARNHPTMEVRIWNSTRAAWRIEMYARISHHLTSPDVYEALFAEAGQWLPAEGAPLDVAHQTEVLIDVLTREDLALEPLLRRQQRSFEALAQTNDPIQFTLS